MLAQRPSLSSLSLYLASWLTCVSRSAAHVDYAGHDEKVYASCELALGTVHFLDQGTSSSKLVEKCWSNLRIRSLYLCLREHGPVDATPPGLVKQNDTCHSELKTWLPPLTFIDSISHDDTFQLRQLSVDDRKNAIQLNETAIVDARLYAAAFNTLDSASYARKHHMLYAIACVVFWTIVVSLGLFSRCLSWHNRRPAKSKTPDYHVSWSLLSARVWLRRWLTVPATFGHRCAQNIGWCTIPPRLQSLTILTFILINLAFCVSGYLIVEDNLHFPGVTMQLLRYVSDRTGIISFANFPLIWLFGMRNNLLLWLTGWNFGTYNNFHRWLARVATLQAVIHSVGYTILVLKEGGWSFFVLWWSFLFWWTGEIGTIFMCAILACSVLWMRRKHYETFLLVHIFLSILVLLTMFGHVSIFKGLFNIFIYVPCAIWILDRLCRVLRTLAFNIRFWNNKALLSYDCNSNVIRLVVPNDKSIYKLKSGRFYYIHVLNDHRFWESHPFTMAYATTPSCLDLPQAEEATPLLNGNINLGLQKTQSKSHAMTFLIRPYDSFTQRLKNHALRHRSASTSIRVLVEGPYGHTEPLHTFNHILFIIGGSGIVVPLSYLISVLNSRHTKTVKIVWAVRELQFAEHVVAHDLAPFVNHKKLRLKVCVTQAVDMVNAESSLRTSTENIQFRRPDVRHEVKSFAKYSNSDVLAVVSCGPPTMSDDTRQAVVDSMDQHRTDIQYFQETFGW